MSEENLTLVFCGSAVENGDIDVQDLAPALLAMGEMMQAANHEINGDRAQISVKVRATAKGSFEVDITLAQSLIENTKTLLNFSADHKDGITALSDLTDLIFKIVGSTIATGGGLFALIKFLRGKKPDKTEEKNGVVRIHAGGNYFDTNKKAIQLAESVAVRQQAKKAMSSLSKSGIDTIKIKRPSQADLEVTKSEVGHFEYEQVEEKLTDEIREMTLQIISLSFKEDNKWRVTDGQEPFNVTIEDTNFLNQIANNEIAFSKGDYLECHVRERQFYTAKGLKKESSITEVKKHKTATQQLRIL